jgi:hypothetical protein
MSGTTCTSARELDDYDSGGEREWQMISRIIEDSVPHPTSDSGQKRLSLPNKRSFHKRVLQQEQFHCVGFAVQKYNFLQLTCAFYSSSDAY